MVFVDALDRHVVRHRGQESSKHIRVSRCHTPWLSCDHRESLVSRCAWSGRGLHPSTGLFAFIPRLPTPLTCPLKGAVSPKPAVTSSATQAQGADERRW